METNACPYCSVSAEDAWISNGLATAWPHPEPAAPLHVLVAPARHVATFYELDVQEQQAIWGIIGEIQKKLAGEMELVGLDLGFQDGAPEQGHTHVHVVPRTPGPRARLPQGPEWVFSETW